MFLKLNVYIVIFISVFILSSSIISADSKHKKITKAQAKQYQTSKYILSSNYKKRGKIRLGNTGKYFTVKNIKSKNKKKGTTCVIEVSLLTKEVLKLYTAQTEEDLAEDIEFAPVVGLGFDDYFAVVEGDDGSITQVYIPCALPGGNDCVIYTVVN